MPTQMSAPSLPQQASRAAQAETDASSWVHLTFWQKRWVQTLLPLATSLVIHLIPIFIAVLIVVPYQTIIHSVQQEQIIIPEATLVDDGPVGGVQNPGLGGDPNLSAAQNADPNVSSTDGWASKRSESLTATLMGGGAPDAADSVIGLGERSGIIGTGGQGSGGNGSLGGGALAPFGVAGGGGGIGPSSPFMGISGNAHKVVYICDASGSMMSVIPRVRYELRAAVEVLKPTQAFNVIFFGNRATTALSNAQLVMATPENKRKAYAIAENQTFAEGTEPLEAIRLAFKQQPELIYVLTDGFDAIASVSDVVNEFRRLNAEKKVKVNTILIRSSDLDLEKVMRVIASENGGVCKVIDRQDM